MDRTGRYPPKQTILNRLGAGKCVQSTFYSQSCLESRSETYLELHGRIHHRCSSPTSWHLSARLGAACASYSPCWALHSSPFQKVRTRIGRGGAPGSSTKTSRTTCPPRPQSSRPVTIDMPAPTNIRMACRACSLANGQTFKTGANCAPAWRWPELVLIRLPATPYHQRVMEIGLPRPMTAFALQMDSFGAMIGYASIVSEAKRPRNLDAAWRSWRTRRR